MTLNKSNLFQGNSDYYFPPLRALVLIVLVDLVSQFRIFQGLLCVASWGSCSCLCQPFYSCHVFVWWVWAATMLAFHFGILSKNNGTLKSKRSVIVVASVSSGDSEKSMSSCPSFITNFFFIYLHTAEPGRIKRANCIGLEQNSIGWLTWLAKWS